MLEERVMISNMLVSAAYMYARTGAKSRSGWTATWLYRYIMDEIVARRE